MKLILTAALLAALSACGSFSPQSLRSNGVRSDFKRAGTNPTALARCMARQAEQYRTTFGDAFTAALRPGEAPDSWEMIVSVNGSSATAAVSDIVPTQAGAYATIWKHPYLYDLLPNVMAEGCP